MLRLSEMRLHTRWWLLGGWLWMAPQCQAFWNPFSGKVGGTSYVQCLTNEQEIIVTVMADDAAVMSNVWESAAYATGCAGQWLGAVPSTARLEVQALTSVSAWSKMARRQGWRADSLAMQQGGKISILWSTNQAANSQRLAHEICHWRLWLECRTPLPLWLEEGLTIYAGKRVAAGWAYQRGMLITRETPDLATNQLYNLGALAAVSAYPENAQQAAAFYRQSESAVRYIVQRIGKTQLPQFVSGVSAPRGEWQALLRERWGWTDQDFDDMSRQIQAIGERGVSEHGD